MTRNLHLLLRGFQDIWPFSGRAWIPESGLKYPVGARCSSPRHAAYPETLNTRLRNTTRSNWVRSKPLPHLNTGILFFKAVHSENQAYRFRHTIDSSVFALAAVFKAVSNLFLRRLPVALLLMGASSLAAQQDVTVTVIDYRNEPVSDIQVLLTNDSRGLQSTQVTGEQGKVVFKGLPAVDGYRVSVNDTDNWIGTSTIQFGIRTNENPTLQLILLEQKTLQLQEVQVLATRSTRINRRDAEVSFELPREEIEMIPIEGRDMTRVLFRLPNVSQATGFYPEAPNVSINGANSLFTSYLIDGLDNNERFLGGQKFAIPAGFTKDVTVLTNNYSAEYGLTANGVINMTTRSGSNAFTGEAFFITRPGPVIDGASDFAQRDLSGNQVKDGFQRYQGGVAFGGPIVKDQTFFYFDFEHTTDLKDNLLNAPALGVNETVRGTNHFTYLSGKVDHNWSSRFRSSLRANAGFVEIERQGGGLDGGVTFPSAGNTQLRNSLLLANKNTYIGRSFSAETNVQFARFRWNYADPANPGNPQVILIDPAGDLANPLGILGSPDFAFDQTEHTWQVQQKFNVYLGRHTLKAGAGIIFSDHQLVGGGNVNGNYRVQLSQDQLDDLRRQNLGAGLDIDDIPSNATVLNYDVELRPAAISGNQRVYSVFVEDQWSATDRLNLTLGLRYDYDNLSRGGSTDGDYNNLAPRLNANYQLGRRSALRAGYGIFYDKIPYAVFSDALQQNTTSQDYRTQLQKLVDLGILPGDTDLDQVTFNGNLIAFLGPEAMVPYLDGPTPEELQGQRESIFSNERRILNPNGWANPYTHQFTLGYQLQVSEKSRFYVDLVHNRSFNLFRLRNLNAAAEYPISRQDVENAADPADLVRTPAQADATRPIPIITDETGSYALIDGERVDGIARNVVMTETEGQSRYYAASFVYQKERGNDDYSLLFNYTLSYLENNTEDINFRATDGNNFEQEWGPSINDRRHIINGIFNYFPLKGLAISVAALLQSGQPINRIPDAATFGTTDLNGDGSFFGDAYVGNSDRYPGESRNSDRLPWSNTFDVGIQYDFPLGKQALELRADVFNVFNAQNLSGYSNNATQSNQIQPGPRDSGVLIRRNASAPRQFQFGVRYLW